MRQSDPISSCVAAAKRPTMALIGGLLLAALSLLGCSTDLMVGADGRPILLDRSRFSATSFLTDAQLNSLACRQVASAVDDTKQGVCLNDGGSDTNTLEASIAYKLRWARKGSNGLDYCGAGYPEEIWVRFNLPELEPGSTGFALYYGGDAISASIAKIGSSNYMPRMPDFTSNCGQTYSGRLDITTDAADRGALGSYLDIKFARTKGDRTEAPTFNVLLLPIPADDSSDSMCAQELATTCATPSLLQSSTEALVNRTGAISPSNGGHYLVAWPKVADPTQVLEQLSSDDYEMSINENSFRVTAGTGQFTLPTEVDAPSCTAPGELGEFYLKGAVWFQLPPESTLQALLEEDGVLSLSFGPRSGTLPAGLAFDFLWAIRPVLPCGGGAIASPDNETGDATAPPEVPASFCESGEKLSEPSVNYACAQDVTSGTQTFSADESPYWAVWTGAYPGATVRRSDDSVITSGSSEYRFGYALGNGAGSCDNGALSSVRVFEFPANTTFTVSGSAVVTPLDFSDCASTAYDPNPAAVDNDPTGDNPPASAASTSLATKQGQKPPSQMKCDDSEITRRDESGTTKIYRNRCAMADITADEAVWWSYPTPSSTPSGYSGRLRPDGFDWERDVNGEFWPLEERFIRYRAVDPPSNVNLSNPDSVTSRWSNITDWGRRAAQGSYKDGWWDDTLNGPDRGLEQLWCAVPHDPDNENQILSPVPGVAQADGNWKTVTRAYVLQSVRSVGPHAAAGMRQRMLYLRRRVGT